jgi:hypothetical protein
VAQIKFLFLYRVRGPFSTPALLRSLMLCSVFIHTLPLLQVLHFLFDDIDKTPIVRHRKRVADSSGFIFVVAKKGEDAAPIPKLHVSAGPGVCIKVKFISSTTADSVFGSDISADMQAVTKVQLAIFTIVYLWDVRQKTKSLSGTRQSLIGL